MRKNIKIVFIIIISIIILSIIGSAVWINTSTYKALNSIASEIALTDNIYYELKQDYYKFGFVSDSLSSEYGFIFYPGGLVEAESYAPLCIEISSRGYPCFISIMPLNLAILNINAADKIIEDNSKIDKWIIGGHSLGGVMACRHLNSNTKNIIDSLFLLASYCDQKINNDNVKVVSLVGSEDKVLNIKSYNDSTINLTQNTKFEVITGGNHSQFGSYGLQKCDGLPKISQKDQIIDTVDFIITNLINY